MNTYPDPGSTYTSTEVTLPMVITEHHVGWLAFLLYNWEFLA